MQQVKQLSVITTKNDLSVEYFKYIDGIKTQIFNYDDLAGIKNAMVADAIYFRDPFVVDYDMGKLNEAMLTLEKFNGYRIDDTHTLEDLFFEDKWRQFQVFSNFMPESWLLSDYYGNGSVIIKKRISSRARDILFDKSAIDANKYSEYIVQTMLNISKEYRVYVIKGKIVSTVSVKNSKTESQAVKVDHVEPISPELELFCEQVMSKLPGLDFVGLDVAEVDGSLVLIEANRAPQFKKFAQLTNTNLAEQLIKSINL